jgi:hypothetical protein
MPGYIVAPEAEEDLFHIWARSKLGNCGSCGS